jgi:hypothetical protein
MLKTAIRCYCAFCRSERTVYRKRHLSLVDGVLAVVASVSFMLVLWQDFDPRVFVFIGISLCITEMFISFRWRLSIACTRCGFDPVIYKKNPEIAAAKVRAHMERSKEDPMSLFSPPPKLPTVKKSKKAGEPQRLSIRT